MEQTSRTVGVPRLGVTRRQRADLTELLEVVHGELVAHQVQHDVLKGATGVNLSGGLQDARKGNLRVSVMNVSI